MFIIHYKCLIVKTFFNFYAFSVTVRYCSDASLTLRCQAMCHSVYYCVITALPRRGIFNGL